MTATAGCRSGLARTHSLGAVERVDDGVVLHDFHALDFAAVVVADLPRNHVVGLQQVSPAGVYLTFNTIVHANQMNDMAVSLQHNTAQREEEHITRDMMWRTHHIHLLLLAPLDGVGLHELRALHDGCLRHIFEALIFAQPQIDAVISRQSSHIKSFSHQKHWTGLQPSQPRAASFK